MVVCAPPLARWVQPVLLLGLGGCLWITEADEEKRRQSFDSDTDLPVVDEDGDGVPAEEDCNDQDADISPNVPELCDWVDNDCDGVVDGWSLCAGSFELDLVISADADACIVNERPSSRPLLINVSGNGVFFQEVVGNDYTQISFRGDTKVLDHLGAATTWKYFTVGIETEEVGVGVVEPTLRHVIWSTDLDSEDGIGSYLNFDTTMGPKYNTTTHRFDPSLDEPYLWRGVFTEGDYPFSHQSTDSDIICSKWTADFSLSLY